MSQLVHTDYTREQKIDAATHYAINGSYAKLERDLSVPKSTAHSWGTRGDEVWVTTIEHVRTENQDKHIANYHRLTELALSKAEQGISKLDSNNLTANDIKSLVVTGATCTDKGLLLQGKATSISGKDSSIHDLAKQFKALSDSFEEKNANTVLTIDKQGSHTT